MSGLRIKQYRENNNFSQEDLAGFLGVTRRTISRWEQNKSKPNADELSRVAKFIGVSEEELLSEDDTAYSTNVLERISDSVDNLVTGQETINESIVSKHDEYSKKQDELIKELQAQNKQLLSKLDEQSRAVESYKKALDLSVAELRHKKIRTTIVAVTCLIILIIVILTWLFVVNHGLSNRKYIEGTPVIGEQTSLDSNN
ncbi:MAG: helix-turn-helix transcriptional regulator [Clostridiales bacterium]|nr:helix-turn-helix transcriptional regulator [Clostridiales bacterium]